MAFINRTYTFTDGTTAYGSQVDAEIANIVSVINSANTGAVVWDIIKVTTLLPQANVAMGGFKLTGLANGSAATDSATYGQVSAIAGAITGSLLMYPLKAAPTGYLYCDGSAVNRGTYATLYGVVGNIFGSGDGSTTFNLPDYRGKFVRGVNDSSGNDPDAASRTAQASGGNSGDAAGSIQADGFKAHTHVVTDPTHNHSVLGTPTAGGATAVSLGDTNSKSISGISQGTTQYYNTAPLGGGVLIQATASGVTNNNTGGNETRPLNSGIYFFIKI